VVPQGKPPAASFHYIFHDAIVAIPEDSPRSLDGVGAARLEPQ
jgi:hypothetical protein